MIKFREHVEGGKALYSMPTGYIGQQVHVRADSRLVKLFPRGQPVKVHPWQPHGSLAPRRRDRQPASVYLPHGPSRLVVEGVLAAAALPPGRASTRLQASAA